MKTDLSRLDFFPSPFFFVGKVEFSSGVQAELTEEEIVSALRRHTNRDFGFVSWEHFKGNLELIAEHRGIITSIYKNTAGNRFRIVTHLDDFEPTTRIFME